MKTKKVKTTSFSQFRNFLKDTLLLVIIGVLSSCLKQNAGIKKMVEGVVFTDCSGKVAKGQKVYLEYAYYGCFDGGVSKRDSTLTDNFGYYKFVYNSQINDGSTTTYYEILRIPNTFISIQNPEGQINLYPYDTLMNAFIKLHFNNTYSKYDTFYCQHLPTQNNTIMMPENFLFITGPIRDTTIILNNLKIGNVHSADSGTANCGYIKWSFGFQNLNRYATGRDGSFNLNHKPCNLIDSFEINVMP